MSKAVKTAAFVKPTQEEVINFIDRVMKDWPSSFCRIMGEKFFMTYQSCGWRLSKNIPMKCWEAAWHGRWKYNLNPTDKALLETHLRMPEHRIEVEKRAQERDGLFAGKPVDLNSQVNPLQRFLDKVDTLFLEHKAGTAKIPALHDVAQELRQNKLLILPRDQIDRIKTQGGNDGDFIRLLAIRQFFDNLTSRGLTFRQYFYSRFQSAQQ